MVGYPTPTAPGGFERMMIAAAIRAQHERRLPEAAALLESVLRAQPDHHDALCRVQHARAGGGPSGGGVAGRRGSPRHPASALAQNLLGVGAGTTAASQTRSRACAARSRSIRNSSMRRSTRDRAARRGDPEAALPCYQKALALEPARRIGHNNLGNLYRELRRPADATAAYRRALGRSAARACARQSRQHSQGSGRHRCGHRGLPALACACTERGGRLEQSAVHDELPRPGHAGGDRRGAPCVRRAFRAPAGADVAGPEPRRPGPCASGTWRQIFASTPSLLVRAAARRR